MSLQDCTKSLAGKIPKHYFTQKTAACRDLDRLMIAALKYLKDETESAGSSKRPREPEHEEAGPSRKRYRVGADEVVREVSSSLASSSLSVSATEEPGPSVDKYSVTAEDGYDSESSGTSSPSINPAQSRSDAEVFQSIEVPTDVPHTGFEPEESSETTDSEMEECEAEDSETELSGSDTLLTAQDAKAVAKPRPAIDTGKKVVKPNIFIAMAMKTAVPPVITKATPHNSELSTNGSETDEESDEEAAMTTAAYPVTVDAILNNAQPSIVDAGAAEVSDRARRAIQESAKAFELSQPPQDTPIQAQSLLGESQGRTDPPKNSIEHDGHPEIVVDSEQPPILVCEKENTASVIEKEADELFVIDTTKTSVEIAVPVNGLEASNTTSTPLHGSPRGHAASEAEHPATSIFLRSISASKALQNPRSHPEFGTPSPLGRSNTPIATSAALKGKSVDRSSLLTPTAPLADDKLMESLRTFRAESYISLGHHAEATDAEDQRVFGAVSDLGIFGLAKTPEHLPRTLKELDQMTRTRMMAHCLES